MTKFEEELEFELGSVLQTKKQVTEFRKQIRSIILFYIDSLPKNTGLYNQQPYIYVSDLKKLFGGE